MFLVDSAEAGADWDGVMAAIKRVLERAEAEIVSMRKWDDRRLAYEIRGKARGTYILCYFRADGGKIRDIEKAVQLSDKIMRVLVLNAERLKAEDIGKDTPATKTEKERDKLKTAKEAPREAEEKQPSSQQAKQPVEETEQAVEEVAPIVEEAKQAVEEVAQAAEEAEQDEKTKQALDEQEAEDLQESEPNTPADD